MINTLAETMSAVPEPMFLLFLGFVMIGLSMRFRSSHRQKDARQALEQQRRPNEPLGKTVPA